MPYLAHFGLKEHPFTLTPNIDYYYPTQETANIVASLDFALRRDSGIVKVVGEVGTGKTLLCRLLMHKLEDGERVAYINAPQADAQTIVRTVCAEFGIAAEAESDSPYAALNRFLVETHGEGKLAVVVVDEAQHLGRDGLEAIRLISNLETERSKLLQIVLFGQTELDELLRDPSLRQLNQRVVFAFNTKPLTPDETRRYIAHRIKVSRQEGVVYDIYSDAAIDLIARASGGIPRVVNILADKSLLVAFSEGSPTVNKAHATSAIKDSPGLPTGAAARGKSRRIAMVAAGALALLAACGAGAYLLTRNRAAEPLQPPPEAPPPAPAPAPPPAAATEPPPPVSVPPPAPIPDQPAEQPPPAVPPAPSPPPAAPAPKPHPPQPKPLTEGPVQ